MFNIKEEEHFEYVQDFDFNICEFVSFINLLFEDKNSLSEILESSAKTSNFFFVLEEDDNSFLVLSILNTSTNAICSRLLIDPSLKDSQGFFQIIKQLLLISAQNFLSYKITPLPCDTPHAAPLLGLGTRRIFVIKKQPLPTHTRRLAEIISTHKRSAKILINKINYGNLWRSRPKSEILIEGSVRLDLQGLDQEKYNYQLQVARDTIAAVLIDVNISKISIPSEQVYAVRKIKSAFQQALDTMHVYKVSFQQN